MKQLRSYAWRIRNRAIERLARWGGRMLYKGHVTWLADDQWATPYLRYLQSDARPQEGYDYTRILDRRFTLLQFSSSVAGLKGSTAECGVFRGVGSALICRSLRGTYGERERHYGFDAWEGLPDPTDRDRMPSGACWWKRGALLAPKAQADSMLEEFDCCELRHGWIPETFSGLEEAMFRFVHIDVDLYEPTKASLEFFFQRMVPGGIILFDDYGFESCPGAKAAVDEYFSANRERVIVLATGQAFVTRQT